MNLTPRATARWIFVAVACSAWIAGSCSNEAPPADTQEGATEADAAVASRTSSSPAPDVDPCTLLTAAEIEEFMGKPPGPPEHGGLPEIPECSWSPAAGIGPPIKVSVHYGPAPASYEEYLEYTRETLGEQVAAGYERVDGLGDYGVWSDITPEWGLLEIHDGELWLLVSASAAGGLTARENSIALAEKAMARIP